MSEHFVIFFVIFLYFFCDRICSEGGEGKFGSSEGVEPQIIHFGWKKGERERKRERERDRERERK